MYLSPTSKHHDSHALLLLHSSGCTDLTIINQVFQLSSVTFVDTAKSSVAIVRLALARTVLVV